jgi:hypothetical protein
MKLNMKSKPVIAALALAAVALVLAALYFSGAFKPRQATVQGLPHVFGTLVAATPSSVTIADEHGKPVTLSVNAGTQVITQVGAGEKGRTLEQIPLQSRVVIVQDAADATVAASISPLPAPPMPTQGIMLTSAEGTVLSKAADSFMLQKDDGTPIKIAVSASTKILSNVAAGEEGKGFESIKAGDRVGAVGTLDAGVSIDAVQLLILRPVIAASSSPAL